MKAVDSSLEDVSVEMLAYPRKLFYFRHLLSNAAEHQLSFHVIKKTSPGFLEALVLARDYECTDPRDHIFALWNVAQDRSGLQYTPTYSKPYTDVYTDFCRAWIRQHGALDMLGAVEMTTSNMHFYEHAPSWCPNWNVSATASCLVRKDYIPTRLMMALGDQDGNMYSADGNMNSSLFDGSLISFEGNALHCCGIIIDEVTYLFDEPPPRPESNTEGIPRCGPDFNWQFICFTKTIRKNHEELKVTAYEDPMRAAWAMLHGDSIAAWPPLAESGYEADVSDPYEQYKCLPHLSRHVPRYGTSYDQGEAWSAVQNAMRGRRPIITRNGYMGLAPAYISELEKEDKNLLQLAVIAGCSVPLLLHERKDETYQLVGTCFVQGWMDGEWMETMMGADSPKEFWEGIRDGAQLVIT
jgi:hypothetical protein